MSSQIHTNWSYGQPASTNQLADDEFEPSGPQRTSSNLAAAPPCRPSSGKSRRASVGAIVYEGDEHHFEGASFPSSARLPTTGPRGRRTSWAALEDDQVPPIVASLAGGSATHNSGSPLLRKPHRTTSAMGGYPMEFHHNPHFEDDRVSSGNPNSLRSQAQLLDHAAYNAAGGGGGYIDSAAGGRPRASHSGMIPVGGPQSAERRRSVGGRISVSGASRSPQAEDSAVNIQRNGGSGFALQQQQQRNSPSVAQRTRRASFILGSHEDKVFPTNDSPVRRDRRVSVGDPRDRRVSVADVAASGFDSPELRGQGSSPDGGSYPGYLSPPLVMVQGGSSNASLAHAHSSMYRDDYDMSAQGKPLQKSPRSAARGVPAFPFVNVINGSQGGGGGGGGGRDRHWCHIYVVAAIIALGLAIGLGVGLGVGLTYGTRTTCVSSGPSTSTIVTIIGVLPASLANQTIPTSLTQQVVSDTAVTTQVEAVQQAKALTTALSEDRTNTIYNLFVAWSVANNQQYASLEESTAALDAFTRAVDRLVYTNIIAESSWSGLNQFSGLNPEEAQAVLLINLTRVDKPPPTPEYNGNGTINGNSTTGNSTTGGFAGGGGSSNGTANGTANSTADGTVGRRLLQTVTPPLFVNWTATNLTGYVSVVKQGLVRRSGQLFLGQGKLVVETDGIL